MGNTVSYVEVTTTNYILFHLTENELNTFKLSESLDGDALIKKILQDESLELLEIIKAGRII